MACRAQKSEQTKKLPVLIVSSVEDPRKAMALGADDYRARPLRRIWLLDRLHVTGIEGTVAGSLRWCSSLTTRKRTGTLSDTISKISRCSIVEGTEEDGLKLAANEAGVDSD